jgi:hypothetical protein
MFNKIVVSVISSVVMFACNTSDSTNALDADVVSSSVPVAPEAIKTQDVPSSTPALSPVTSPSVPSVVNPVAGGVTTDPLVAPSVNTGAAVVGSTSAPAPAAATQPASLQMGSPVVTPVTSTTTVK